MAFRFGMTQINSNPLLNVHFIVLHSFRMYVITSLLQLLQLLCCTDWWILHQLALSKFTLSPCLSLCVLTCFYFCRKRNLNTNGFLIFYTVLKSRTKIRGYVSRLHFGFINFTGKINWFLHVLASEFQKVKWETWILKLTFTLFIAICCHFCFNVFCFVAWIWKKKSGCFQRVRANVHFISQT